MPAYAWNRRPAVASIASTCLEYPLRQHYQRHFERIGLRSFQVRFAERYVVIYEEDLNFLRQECGKVLLLGHGSTTSSSSPPPTSSRGAFSREYKDKTLNPRLREMLDNEMKLLEELKRRKKKAEEDAKQAAAVGAKERR
mmetsp:Transcript_28177/g.79075  ORF Transcript_28177/g.79075 Transcript_28177/m.79075 type:complete len:140 (-) Transcript_28177:86-505(-)